MKKKKKVFFVFATSFLSKENQLIANSLIYSLSLSSCCLSLSSRCLLFFCCPKNQSIRGKKWGWGGVQGVVFGININKK